MLSSGGITVILAFLRLLIKNHVVAGIRMTDRIVRIIFQTNLSMLVYIRTINSVRARSCTALILQFRE